MLINTKASAQKLAILFPSPVNSSEKQTNPSCPLNFSPIKCTGVRSFKIKQTGQNQHLKKKLTWAIIFHLSNQQYSFKNNTQCGRGFWGQILGTGSNPAPRSYTAYAQHTAIIDYQEPIRTRVQEMVAFFCSDGPEIRWDPDPLLQYCNACMWANLSSNKIQKNYMELKK